MSVVEKLMDGAVSDVKVLRLLDSQGDDFSKFRDVDFLLRCPSKEKAELVAKFLDDHEFGKAVTVECDSEFRVQVVINMPVRQNIISPVAGFMTCIAALYGLEFDGWGCVAQRE